ncbi:MAG: CPBP family intramembrane metalloprotease [Undibacterium sp.]|nr:CPBP family intramembrane metalloprotease [Undibacterium sp.]
MRFNIFMSPERQLLNFWWILIFFIVLASMLIPCIVLASANGGKLAIEFQALLIIITTVICQRLRRASFFEVWGHIDRQWFKQLLWGIVAGTLLMLLPAILLMFAGLLHFQLNTIDYPSILTSLSLFVAVAVSEELTFHGFMFQRLVNGVGVWIAQLGMSAYFLLNHSDALISAGSIGYLAGLNIFIAGLMFGMAYLYTKSLALPIGIHFAANLVQGGILGFGVSGSSNNGIFTPIFDQDLPWLTGGQFGLEASIPGLLAVTGLTLFLWTYHKKMKRTM